MLVNLEKSRILQDLQDRDRTGNQYALGKLAVRLFNRLIILFSNIYAPYRVNLKTTIFAQNGGFY
jgi:hypothetical protein